MRLGAAKRLLEEGHKVYSVATLVGYKSRKNFYQQFKRAYGITPGTYATAKDTKLVIASVISGVTARSAERRLAHEYESDPPDE